MAEPTIPEMVRVGLEFLQEMWEAPGKRFRVNWPDDLEGQGLSITHLASLVESPDCPWNVRAWAFDTLEEIAAQYRFSNKPDAISFELFSWAFLVFSGDIERPKRPRGRDGEKNRARDQAIANTVAWLRSYQGYTYEGAIELVAKAAYISTEAVKTVLKRDRDSGRPSPLERVKAVFSLMSIPVTPNLD